MTLAADPQLAACIASNYAQPVDAKAVGRNLRKIREARAESQEIVAARMGVKQSEVSTWETGRYRSFDMQTLINLAQGYGSSVDDLLVGVDETYDRTRAEAAHDEKHITNESGRGSTKTGRVDQPTQRGPLAIQQDQQLHGPAAPAGSPYDAPHLAETRAEIERILADLTAVAKSLPRRQAAMARGRGSGDAARPRGHDRHPDRQTKKKPARQ